MIPITTQELKRNIQEALEAGVPKSRIERMKDCLNKLESGVFANQKSTGLMYREIVRDGKKIIEMANPSDRTYRTKMQTLPLAAEALTAASEKRHL